MNAIRRHLQRQVTTGLKKDPEHWRMKVAEEMKVAAALSSSWDFLSLCTALAGGDLWSTKFRTIKRIVSEWRTEKAQPLG